MILSSVDFPAPLRPTRPRISPCATSHDTSRSAQNVSARASPRARLTHSDSCSASIVARRLAKLYDLPTSRIESAGPALNDVGILSILMEKEERAGDENHDAGEGRYGQRMPVHVTIAEQRGSKRIEEWSDGV